MSFLLKGLIIGFSIAAPVGPIGLLCIQRTLYKGRKSGFFSGLGAAVADGTYGIIAAFGLTFIMNILLGQKDLIRLVGGIFLIYLGVKTFISKPKTEVAKSTEKEGVIQDFLSTLFLTITNPMTIMSFLGIFAGVGIGKENPNYYLSSLLVLGVFLGSALWWFILSFIVSFFREKFNQDMMNLINKFSGSIIILFGLISLKALI